MMHVSLFFLSNKKFSKNDLNRSLIDREVENVWRTLGELYKREKFVFCNLMILLFFVSFGNSV